MQDFMIDTEEKSNTKPLPYGTDRSNIGMQTTNDRCNHISAINQLTQAVKK